MSCNCHVNTRVYSHQARPEPRKFRPNHYGGLLVKEAIFPLMWQRPSSNVLEDAAMGELLLDVPPAWSALCWNPNTRLSGEKYNLGRKTEDLPWIVAMAAGFFCWLVHSLDLRTPRGSRMRTFRNDLWYHRRYQQTLGKCGTKKKPLALLNYSGTVGCAVPKEAFAEPTCMKWQDRQQEQITIAAL